MELLADFISSRMAAAANKSNWPNWSDATCLKKKDNKKLSIFCLCQNKPVYLHRFVPTGPCGRVG